MIYTGGGVGGCIRGRGARGQIWAKNKAHSRLFGAQTVMQQHLEMGRTWKKKNIPETSPPPKEREEGMLQINFF